jgi:hypothetical protein
MDESNFRKYVDKFFDELVLYDDYVNGHFYKDLLKAGIDVFFDNETHYNAFEIYRTFFMIYQITAEDKSEESETISLEKQPNTLLKLVEIMKKYEESTGDLLEKQRDHFVHSVNVFLLGIAIYAQNKNYQKYFKQYVLRSPYKKYYRIEGELTHEEFLYRWGVASLFHDIGYPVEIIGKQLKQFLNDSIKSISSAYGAQTAIDFKDFNEFNTIVKMKTSFADDYNEQYPQSKFFNMFKPTDIMAHKIALDFDSVDINDVAKHMDSFVDIMGESGFIDHGFFSSILVLNSYGYLIQEYSKSNDFFFYPIVDSATAILLHNYYKNVLQKDPFNLKELNPSKSPLAYLLILCDELQEWNRQPLGIMDRQKGNVNEFELKVDDVSLDIKYVVKAGSMGLGFSEDKVELLNRLLSVQSVFDSGLKIRTELSEDNVLKEIVRSESQAPDILLRNVEKLAKMTHQQYLDSKEKEYKKREANGTLDEKFLESYNSLTSYDELSPQLKIANIRQARSIPTKLDIIGCELAYPDDEREPITEFLEEEVIDLAIFEHDEWCQEKIGTGWTYGPVRDDSKFIHDCIVPWDDLTPEIQQYDIDPVKNIPHLVDELGLKIVRTKHRMLTIEMHNFYDEEADFDKLPDYVKYSNYKQADVLVEIISELGYSIVDKEDEGNAISTFNEDEIDYLAEREHHAWYILKINMGWRYDSVRDEEAKTNPNLVKWEDLGFETQEMNRRTFRNLPALGDRVGLKIVKK